MTNAKIEEIYALVEKALKKGQKSVPVHIYPFKMTEDNMAFYADNQWIDFWMNLKEGYDYFEAEKLPPTIRVKNGKYLILEANE
jgi:murein L,D-transpeptidase YafK